MRPWEEEWFDSGLGSIDVIHPDGHTETGVMTIDPCERTRLVSAAPDLVRALLAVEWVELEPHNLVCPSCGAPDPTDLKNGKGHEVHCALDAALRKSGVR